MRVVSFNVGLPREVMWKGKRVTTGVFKEPVEGRVMMRTLNLDGEEGEISTEDAIELIRRDVNNIKVSNITRLYTREKGNLELLRRTVEIEALSESWQRHFRRQIEKASHEQTLKISR